MYPRILEIPFGDAFTLTIYSFGFMVAVAILTAAWLAGRELDRMQKAGQIDPIRVPVKEAGKKKAKDRKRKSKPTLESIPASEIMGTVIILAGIFGIAGSKLFHILENLPQFFQDPMRMIFSAGGLTFYGGLICAGLAISWYVKKKGIAPSLMADAVAPGLMLAYGIGRIGCHLSGDGDWGITSDLSNKPGWIPDWLWAETYPNNINGEVLLGDGVFPTPLYEFAMSAVLFGILWGLRRHPFKAGWLFGLYLVLAGAERLLIEQIRVNNTFDLLGMTVTQAEVISVIMILVGIILLIRTSQKRAELSSSKNVMPATG